jgi:hypothetical protein
MKNVKMENKNGAVKRGTPTRTNLLRGYGGQREGVFAKRSHFLGGFAEGTFLQKLAKRTKDFGQDGVSTRAP